MSDQVKGEVATRASPSFDIIIPQTFRKWRSKRLWRIYPALRAVHSLERYLSHNIGMVFRARITHTHAFVFVLGPSKGQCDLVLFLQPQATVSHSLSYIYPYMYYYNTISKFAISNFELKLSNFHPYVVYVCNNFGRDVTLLFRILALLSYYGQLKVYERFYCCSRRIGSMQNSGFYSGADALNFPLIVL